MKLSAEEVHRAIQDPEWQIYRDSMKGQPTRRKLVMLDMWLDQHSTAQNYIQVQNYLNALSRGGQIYPINRDLGVRQQISSARIKR